MWEDIQGRRFPGYGRCIYCDSDGGAEGLRDEHVIPFSLGGNTCIEKASCRDCERKISPVDTHLGRSVFGQHRIHAGVQTRRPKERPAILPANFTVRDESVSLDLPIKDHPYALALPVWGDAGFLRGVRIDDPLPETFFHIYHWIPPNVRESLNISQDEDYRVWAWGRVDTSLFARAIAKIAYCHTVIWLGLGGFRRLALPGVILGTCSAVSYFVGGALKDPPPKFDTKALHTIQFNNLTGVASKLRLYIVSIRLFAHSGSGQHGMPIYHVVVGAPLVGSSAIR
jgi:hypothetical protein